MVWLGVPLGAGVAGRVWGGGAVCDGVPGGSAAAFLLDRSSAPSPPRTPRPSRRPVLFAMRVLRAFLQLGISAGSNGSEKSLAAVWTMATGTPEPTPVICREAWSEPDWL